jgi:BirA family transcriptional regulator, biotin operon repressor / biotin---[acetyl-CoA-carboxylase] ligase
MFVVSPRFLDNLRISTARKTRRRAALGSASFRNTAAPSQQPTDVRLGRIVRLLMEHATVVVSGTKIAQEISCSRSEVWRLIQRLRSLGVEVAGHPATGYQLCSVPDLLLPEILRPLVRGTIFDPEIHESEIHHFYRIGSTNTAAMAAAAAGTEEGSVILAEQQTAGRGRGSNAWHSPRSSGLYCSLILRPALPPSEVLVLSLAAGLAVQAAIRQIDPQAAPDLKWPNDVLIGGRKVSGILTEMNAEATRVRFVVVGIGINVNQTSFPEGLDAISLRQATGHEWSRVELVAALLKSMDREYREIMASSGARKSILRRFAENSSWVRGKSVSVTENGGSTEGITEGLDDRGFLRVRTANGLQTVLSGTVRTK